MFDTLFKNDWLIEIEKRFLLRRALLEIAMLNPDNGEKMRDIAKEALKADMPNIHDFSLPHFNRQGGVALPDETRTGTTSTKDL